MFKIGDKVRFIGGSANIHTVCGVSLSGLVWLQTYEYGPVPETSLELVEDEPKTDEELAEAYRSHRKAYIEAGKELRERGYKIEAQGYNPEYWRLLTPTNPAPIRFVKEIVERKIL